jgi:Type II secretory pathway, component PulF
LKFGYRVRDELGRLKSGIFEAEHKDTAIAGLLNQNYYIVSLQELQPAESWWRWEIDLGRLKRVPGQDVIVLTRQLSIMMAAGLPIMRCFRILEEQAANPRLKQVVLQLQDDVETGSSLWEAFSRHPAIFSEVYISMLKAGETAGTLDTVLNKLSYQMAKEHEFSAKLKSASIYPIFLSVIAFIVVLLIITLVIPKFAGVFASAGIELPLPTRLLIGLGAFLQTKGLVILLGLLVIIGLLRWFKRTPEGKFAYDTVLLHLPVAGKYMKRLALARFARTLGILAKSGINIVQALEVVKGVVGNAVIGRVVEETRNSILEGDSIASPLQNSGWFDPLVIHMITVGEETGRLDDMLIHLSDFYEGELMRTLESLSAMIEPLLILIVALIIGGVVVAVLYPMFDMINMVGI